MHKNLLVGPVPICIPKFSKNKYHLLKLFTHVHTMKIKYTVFYFVQVPKTCIFISWLIFKWHASKCEPAYKYSMFPAFIVGLSPILFESRVSFHTLQDSVCFFDQCTGSSVGLLKMLLLQHQFISHFPVQSARCTNLLSSTQPIT